MYTIRRHKFDLLLQRRSDEVAAGAVVEAHTAEVRRRGAACYVEAQLESGLA